MLDDFTAWLADTPLAIALTDSQWAFTTIESFHVLALTAVVGSIGLIDLRLLGLAWRDRDADALMRELLPFTWIAFTVAAITGGLMFVANPISYAANPAFRIKLVLLVAAGMNVLLFHRFVLRRAAHGSSARRISAGLSLTLWLSILGLGRWIGFSL